MSYILDALRRAESERERGSVPTLHTHPVPADRAEDDAGPGRPRAWVWAVAALLLLLILAAVALRGWNPSRGPAPAAPAVAPAAVVPPPMQPASQGQVLPPAAPAVVAAEPTAPATPELRRLQPAPPPEATPSIPPAPPVAAPQPAPPVALKDLPDEIRRQLPALVANGAMYSETPANRMLIVNGQLLREGDAVAPGLVLEQIQLKSAVLNFKGQRLRISY